MRRRKTVGGRSYLAILKGKKKPVVSYSIRLYHGTDMFFDDPRFDRNKLPCDFGRGFYLTRIKERAKARAEEKALASGKSEK